MAKRKPKPKALLPLTPRGRQVVNHVVNAVAFGTQADECELGAVAAALGTTPGRLRPILAKLSGWVTVTGHAAEFVYPTAAALRWQNRALTEREARAVVVGLSANR
jgi:hypothetical protein